MKLIVGKIDEDLTDLIKSEYPSAVLITEENWQTPIDVGYTGLEEFINNENFLRLLLKASEIFYYPIDEDSKFDINKSTQTTQGYVEYFLFLARQEGIPINSYNHLGLDITTKQHNQLLELVDLRKVEKGPQLWCAGCSFTRGHGVEEHERYANLLSDKLNLPLSVLAKSGSSISWAADQILRSDIRQGDIVVWGLTEKSRMSYIKDGTVTPFFVSGEVTNPVENLISRLFVEDDLFRYYQLTSINQVINFTQKIGAKLLIVGLLADDTDLLYLQHLDCYYHYYYVNRGFKDLGNDDLHPGPLQHQEFAEKITDVLKKRGYV